MEGLRTVLDLALELYALLVVLDVVLAWFEAPDRIPRRWTHPLTEGPQRGLRDVGGALRRRLVGARAAAASEPSVADPPWDLSPLVVLVLCALARVGLGGVP